MVVVFVAALVVFLSFHCGAFLARLPPLFEVVFSPLADVDGLFVSFDLLVCCLDLGCSCDLFCSFERFGGSKASNMSAGNPLTSSSGN